MSDKQVELQVDSLVGPTHCYGGMAHGNVPSLKNKGIISNPREAFLQGLQKAKLVSDLGVAQLVFPPHERPHVATLRKLGFTGNDNAVVQKAYKHDPELLYAVCESSSMWMANSGTVSSDCDSADRKLHITPASMPQNFHRSIEAPFAKKLFQIVFCAVAEVHDALPVNDFFGDEGAANHMRFTPKFGGADIADCRNKGVHLFAYGRTRDVPAWNLPRIYKARQSREASEAIARIHKLPRIQTVFARQNPEAIDAGVFHNDVISVNCRNLWLVHELAYCDTKEVVEEVRQKLDLLGGGLEIFVAEKKTLSLAEAVSSYVFNSELLELSTGEIVALAPMEAETSLGAREFLDRVLGSSLSPLKKIFYVDLKQSMKNGGGPACLRLRVPINESRVRYLRGNTFLNQKLYHELREIGEKYYRDYMVLKDLRDPELIRDSRRALDEISKALGLEYIYDFQR